MGTSSVTIIFARLAEGQEITDEERLTAIAALNRLPALRQKAVAGSEEEEQPTTLRLADGRLIDVFRAGTVQVYAADNTAAYELTLPVPGEPHGSVGVVPLGG